MADTGAGKRLTARRLATRRRLLDAASEVFAERGFHGASVEDICERAGFTRGAFYSNFASKDDLVIELSSEHTATLVERIRAAADRDVSPGTVLRDVFAALTAEGPRTEQWLLLTTEFTLHAIRDAEARRAWAQQQKRVRRTLVEVVDEICREHSVSLPMPTELFVRTAVALVQGSMTQRLVEPRSLPVGALEQAVLPLLLDLTPTGSRVQ